MSVDLHRHSEHSQFDGFGKALDLARLAKSKGITALGISDHGTLGGIVEHYKACHQIGIKPILGVEAYFQPKFNKEDPVRASFHLGIYAYNLEGYKNMNTLMSEAHLEQKYYKPITDFALLKKYSKGIFVTSGCIASFLSQTIAKGKMKMARKVVEEFISIYTKEHFYIELMPYELDERTDDDYMLQQRVNIGLVQLAEEYSLKTILTSDSHYGSEHDYETYMKMHEIGGSADFAGETYTQRYMPNKNDLPKRFVAMHKDDFDNVKEIARKGLQGLEDIKEKVDGDILDKLELHLPSLAEDSAKQLRLHITAGLKKLGKHTKEYIDRCKQEYKVIVHHGFEDYFLIVEDYVQWARDQDIEIGPGRGSVCNSTVAYALGITNTDAVKFGLDFNRFLRFDKAEVPDIDLDFETDRRQEVIEYIVEKYPGKAAQICSHGLYRVDNLLNDLAKVCGVGHMAYDEKGKGKFEVDKDKLKELKDYVNSKLVEDDFIYNNFSHEAQCVFYDKAYDNIMLHFSKMHKKLRFIGTHAAGVAIVGTDLMEYTSIETRGSKGKPNFKVTTAFNLDNLSDINVIKFDMLGLRTLSITKELEDMTGECFSYEWLEDPEVYEYFAQGKTDGVFQFEKSTAKGILQDIQTDSFEDVIAASALNRPGPLQLKMPEQYAHNKIEGNYGREPWSDYTNLTYGTIVYQEQIQAISRDIGMLSFEDADRIVKFMKSTNMTEAQIKQRENEIYDLKKDFIAGCKKTKDMTTQEATDLFDKMTVYTFNQGHATGYSLISYEQMYFKVHYPHEFWYATLKYANNDSDLYRLKIEAVKEGNVILLPHVNYGDKYSVVEIQGDKALAEGLSNIKNVGVKAAEFIEIERRANGPFKNREDFIERAKNRSVTSRVITSLEEAGALLFDDDIYFGRVQKYNSQLYSRGLN